MTPDPAPTPTPPGESTRERLFRIAMDGFRAHGYDGLSVSRITRDAGVAKGTFFNHFPSKEHVLAEAFHREVTAVIGAVAQGGESGTGAILAFLSAAGDRLGDDRALSELLLPRLGPLPSPGRGLPRDEDRIRGWFRDRLAETLPIAVPLVEVDHESLAFLLTAAVRGTLEEWAHPDGPARPLEELLTERGLLLLRTAGLPADPPARRHRRPK
jgi:AcrR family transcriptional regulator